MTHTSIHTIDISKVRQMLLDSLKKLEDAGVKTLEGVVLKVIRQGKYNLIKVKSLDLQRGDVIVFYKIPNLSGVYIAIKKYEEDKLNKP